MERRLLTDNGLLGSRVDKHLRIHTPSPMARPNCCTPRMRGTRLRGADPFGRRHEIELVVETFGSESAGEV